MADSVSFSGSMKSGESSKMSTRVSSAYSSSSNVSYFGNPQNYWVTTKGLRDKVLKARNQGANTSNRKYAFKCTSAFQKRNLDNYPMPNTREDAQRSAKGQRSVRRDSEKTMVRDTVYSGAMKSYSKQMFDFAVNCANNANTSAGSQPARRNGGNDSKTNDVNQQPRRRLGSSYSTKSVSMQSCISGSSLGYGGTSRTGPTPDGSILYNNKQRVLNSIRLRPSSECLTEKHQRRHRLSLQETSSDINQQFKLLQTNCRNQSEYGSRRTSLAGSEYVFVPVSGESDYHVLPECVRHTSEVNSILEQLEESDVFEECLDERSHRGVINGYRNGDSVTSESSAVRHPPPVHRPLLPPAATSNIRLVSLDESSSSESEEEPEAPPPEVKKPEPPSKTALKGRAKVVIPEPEPEEKPAPPKLVLKGPKCWVDDATVTSEAPIIEDVDLPDGPAPEQTDPADKRLKPEQCVPSKDIKQSTALAKQTANVADGKENQPVTTTEPVTEQIKFDEPEVKEPEVYLPPFLCPSSEKKSREAELKEWLSNTCFRSGGRHVPLV